MNNLELFRQLKNEKNYANNKSGATILQSSKGIENRSSILESSTDSYIYLPNCKTQSIEKPDYLIINLSEDVQVDNILVSNHEDFSANLHEMLFYGSIDFPPSALGWQTLGSIAPGE